jgi:hypothetical protein
MALRAAFPFSLFVGIEFVLYINLIREKLAPLISENPSLAKTLLLTILILQVLREQNHANGYLGTYPLSSRR